MSDESVTPGQRFGQLTAIEIAGYSTQYSPSVPIWECRCACGDAILVAEPELCDGSRTSCGCRRPRARKREMPLDVPGKVCAICKGAPQPLWEFERDRSIPDGRSDWCLACIRLDPGTYNLRRQEAAAARQAARSEMIAPPSEADQRRLVGQRFGLLLVTACVGTQRAGGRMLWQCDCDCGASAVVPEPQLLSGARDNCGCRMGTGRPSRRRAPTADATKVCNQCGGDPQPLTQFPTNWSNPYGRGQPCKRCAAARRQQRRAETPKSGS